MKKNCTFCGLEFNAIHRYNKFCSSGCFGLSELGRANPNWKGGVSTASAVCMNCQENFVCKRSNHDGKFCSTACHYDFNTKTGKWVNEKNPGWLGDDAGYGAIHNWIRRKFGEPTKCEKCLKTNNERKINWANKGHTYKRIKSDWVQLCYSCHRLFDYGKIKL